LLSPGDTTTAGDERDADLGASGRAELQRHAVDARMTFFSPYGATERARAAERYCAPEDTEAIKPMSAATTTEVRN